MLVVCPDLICIVLRERQRDLLPRRSDSAATPSADSKFDSSEGEIILDSKYVVADIEAVESFGGEKPEDSTWKPVRAKLGIGAFGVNAFVGREVGARVIEEHTEEGSGHQELYVVLAGGAELPRVVPVIESATHDNSQ